MAKKVLTLLLGFIILLTGCSSKIEPFSLNEEFYSETNSGLIELTSYSTIDTKINDSASFGVYVYNPACASCTLFTPILTQYLHDNNLIFYSITISIYTNYNSKIKNVPTLVLYKDGVFNTFLDPTNNKHTEYFKSVEKLNVWIRTYLIID